MRPLLSWDPIVLRFDLDALQLVANQQLTARGATLHNVRVDGRADGLVLRGLLRLKGLPTPLAVRMSDLRLYRRFFGCRLASLRGPLGLPLPLGVLVSVLDGLGKGHVRFAADDRILTVDLRDWLPPGLDLAVTEVRCLERRLIVAVASGTWTPTTADLLLPSDTSISDLDS
jgi:hypothetical protein